MTSFATKITQSVAFTESPTVLQARRLQFAADLFNRELFDGRLPETLLDLRNKKGCNGYYSPNKWVSAAGEPMDCITLNSTTAIDRPLIELLSTLVHEQCHQYVCSVVNQKAATGGHGPDWRKVMTNLGLPPIRIGNTWRMATHSIDPDGIFAECFRTHASELEAMPWQELAKDATRGKAPGLDKVCFECPSCGAKAWARAAGELLCGTCSTPERLVVMIPEFRADYAGKGQRANASRQDYPEPTKTSGLPVWTDELGREIRLHTGLDHPPQTPFEALLVMLFGVVQRAPVLFDDLCTAASPTADLDSWGQALKAIWKHRASVLHPDAGGSEEAFKCLQIAKRILDKCQCKADDVRTAGEKGMV